MLLSFQLMTSSRLEESQATALRIEVGLPKSSSRSLRRNPDQGSGCGSTYVDASPEDIFLPGIVEEQADKISSAYSMAEPSEAGRIIHKSITIQLLVLIYLQESLRRLSPSGSFSCPYSFCFYST